MQNRDEALTRRILEEFGPIGEFKPFIVYDEPLDSIQVQIADCSVTEKRYSGFIDLLERNHIEDGEAFHVGFSILCARAFCEEYGLPMRGVVSVSRILKKIAEVDKESMPAILDITLPMLIDHFVTDEVLFPAK